MALTKQDWIEHYDAEEEMENLGMCICDAEQSLEDLDPEFDAHEIAETQEQIDQFRSQMDALRENIIPTTPEGDSIESLQDEFDTTVLARLRNDEK